MSASGEWLLPTLARAAFAAVWLGYCWASALTKFDVGPFSLSLGAYAQICARALEAASHDSSQLGPLRHLVVLGGAWAAFLLPLLLVPGLVTRPAALAMVGLVIMHKA